MTEAGRGIQTFLVTEAVRDATIGGRKVKQGQTIALDPDDGLVAVDGDRDEGGAQGRRGAETGLRADHAVLRRRRDLTETEAWPAGSATVAPGAEVEVRHGGQPHYRYLISAE